MPAALLLLLAWPGGPGAAQALPEHRGAVTDLAAFLAPQEKQALEGRLRSWNEGSGNALAVLTVPDLGGRDLESYANQVARSWKLGTAGKNNGILLLVAAKEHKIRIEVGDDLQGDLTDLVSGRIIDLIMVPEFRAGRPGAGIRRGAEAVMAAAGGDFSAIPVRQVSHRQGAAAGGILGSLFGLFLLLMVLGGIGRGRGGRGGGLGGPLTWLFLGSMMGRGLGNRGFGGGGFGGGGFGGGFGGFGGGGGFSGGGASGGW